MNFNRALEDTYYIVGITAPICTVIYLVGRWVLKIRDDVKAIKENHLPHMYYMLRLIADKLNIHEGDGL